jgi:hypothetical protein
MAPTFGRRRRRWPSAPLPIPIVMASFNVKIGSNWILLFRYSVRVVWTCIGTSFFGRAACAWKRRKTLDRSDGISCYQSFEVNERICNGNVRTYVCRQRPWGLVLLGVLTGFPVSIPWPTKLHWETRQGRFAGRNWTPQKHVRLKGIEPRLCLAFWSCFSRFLTVASGGKGLGVTRVFTKSPRGYTQ